VGATCTRMEHCRSSGSLGDGLEFVKHALKGSKACAFAIVAMPSRRGPKHAENRRPPSAHGRHSSSAESNAGASPPSPCGSRLASLQFSHGCRFPLVHWWSSTSDPPDPTGPLNSIETPALGCLAKGCEAEVLVDQRGQRHRAQVPLSGSWQQLHRGALGRRGHFSIFKRTVLPVAITHPGPCSWVSVGGRMRCGPQRYGKCL